MTELSTKAFTVAIDLEFNFGEVSLSQIEKNFKSIKLAGSSTDINLVLNQASYINAQISGIHR